MLVTNPIPEEYSMDPKVINAAIGEALEQAAANGVHGKETTPLACWDFRKILPHEQTVGQKEAPADGRGSCPPSTPGTAGFPWTIRWTAPKSWRRPSRPAWSWASKATGDRPDPAGGKDLDARHMGDNHGGGDVKKDFLIAKQRLARAQHSQ